MTDGRSLAGAALQLPRCFEGILDGTSVASGEVGDNHHVLGVPGWNAEGSWELAHDGVAVAEIGPDDQVHVIKLAGNQPAVVTPLGQPVPCGAAYARQVRGQPHHVVDPHVPGLPSFGWPYA